MRIRRYETVFILEPDIEDARRQEILGRLDGVIQKGEGILIKREDWGVRKLAYDIRRFSKGQYILYDYAGSSRIVSELERNLKMFEPVLRFLTVRQEERVTLEAMEKLRAEEQAKEEARKAAIRERREAAEASAALRAEEAAAGTEDAAGMQAEDEAAGEVPEEEAEEEDGD